MMAGCGSSNPAPRTEVQIPSDGVHMSGAITAVYPITDNATCNVAMVNADKILQFKPNAKTGAVIGLELIRYKGAGTYAPLDWPPYQNSAAWVGLIGGHTWRAFGGKVTVTSDVNGKVSGTLEATGMQEVGGTTTVNASGSWRCQIIAVSPSPAAGTLTIGSPVPPQVLAPAKVLPAVSLCSLPIQIYQDGNAGPVFCSNGLNVQAWKFFALLSPRMLGLDPTSDANAIRAAYCGDEYNNHATNPQEESAWQLAAAYYGWSVNTNPEPAIANHGCV